MDSKHKTKIDRHMIDEYEYLGEVTVAGAKNPGPNYRIKPPLEDQFTPRKLREERLRRERKQAKHRARKNGLFKQE